MGSTSLRKSIENDYSIDKSFRNGRNAPLNSTIVKLRRNPIRKASAAKSCILKLRIAKPKRVGWVESQPSELRNSLSSSSQIKLTTCLPNIERSLTRSSILNCDVEEADQRLVDQKESITASSPTQIERSGQSIPSGAVEQQSPSSTLFEGNNTDHSLPAHNSDLVKVDGNLQPPTSTVDDGVDSGFSTSASSVNQALSVCSLPAKKRSGALVQVPSELKMSPLPMHQSLQSPCPIIAPNINIKEKEGSIANGGRQASNVVEVKKQCQAFPPLLPAPTLEQQKLSFTSKSVTDSMLPVFYSPPPAVPDPPTLPPPFMPQVTSPMKKKSARQITPNVAIASVEAQSKLVRFSSAQADQLESGKSIPLPLEQDMLMPPSTEVKQVPSRPIDIHAMGFDYRDEAQNVPASMDAESSAFVVSGRVVEPSITFHNPSSFSNIFNSEPDAFSDSLTASRAAEGQEYYTCTFQEVDDFILGHPSAS